MIPWAAPLAQYRAHEGEIQSAIQRVVNGGNYVLGPEVEAFERAFASYCGVGHAVGVGSGTDALILALKALGTGPGDEVITVSHTAVATVAAVLACGATPVLVDVDPRFYTLDPAKIDAAITERSRTIVAVHLYGQPADMEAIAHIARARSLHLVEDCAQAAGACYRNRRVGSFGDVACFSFYPTKNLGALGDGGAVLTRDGEVASRVRRLRQYGWDDARNTDGIGVNSRLDPLQAAVLGAKLPYLDADNARRAAIARRYDEALADLPLVRPAAREEGEHVYHLYVVSCDGRDRLKNEIASDGIGSAIHYPQPVHLQRGYDERVIVPRGELPITEHLAGRILSLPIYPELTEREVEQVAESVREHCGQDVGRLKRSQRQ